MARPRPTKSELQKEENAPTNFRDALANVIADWTERGTPVEELQSALHSETAVVDKQFAALVEAEKKTKKGGKK